MSYDVIDRLVRPANPVPDPTMLKPVDVSVLHDMQVRMEVQTQDRVEVEQGPPRTPRKVLIGIAAVVAVVLGGLIVFQLTGEDTVAEPPAQTAEAFLEAFAGFDADTASSYLDEETLESVFGGLDGLRLELGFWEAVGWKMLIGVCGTGEMNPLGVSVQCPYDYNALRSDEMALGPYTGSHWRFRVLDGQIVSASNDLRTGENGFSAQVWEPFAEWMTENHPEDIEIMYTDEGLSDMQMNAESNLLWEQRSAEYVEYVNNPTPTTTPVEGSVPSELAGIWRGRSSTGEMVNFRLEGTSYSVSVGDINFTGDVVVSGETILIPATPDTGLPSAAGSQCANDREFTWSVEGDELILAEVVEDNCFTREYLAGTVFKKFWSP